ncbi:putative ubiquitinyl hydrolase 1 [Microsporum canis]
MHFHYQHLHLHHQQLLQYHQQQLLRQQLLHHHCNEDGYCDFQQPPPPDFLQPRIFHPIPVYNEYVVHHPIMCDMRDEMVEFQKLSNEYEPDLQGPLVGLKQSSVALSREYAQADPIYVAKTTSLAQTHSHYRIMKGDGNCGWRAVAFGYFENLFALQDEAKVVQELARIKSFNRMFDAVGQQEHLYEIFVDATEELLNHMIEHIAGDNPDDMFILETFNDEWNSNAIITHFRLMTSAWMQLNSERYEAFLSVPIEQYCSRTIDTVRTEIDEIGLQALVDGVIEASGFDVQILYLDRSQGDEVNAHQLTSQRNGSLGTIKLLYRPGHYDLLYSSGSPTPVNCQYAMTCDFPPWYPNSIPCDLNPVLMAVPSLPLDQASEPQDHSAYEYEYLYPIHPEHPPAEMIPHHTVPLPEPIQPEVATINLPPRPPPTEDRSSELLIRMNPLVDPDMNCLPLTIPFRNSHFNQAHFQNSEFQPSQWDPSEINKREKKPSSRSGSSSE